jgi:uncharacterized membrane protein YdjX (TVP38/TMEM64 family)
MTRRGKITLTLLLLVGAGGLGLIAFRGGPPARETIVSWYHLITDPERVETFKKAWGPIGGPTAFICLQILQVVLAPFPGEASGFAGGYLFGAAPGFIYSTVGLTIGSIVNFMLGRVLGRRYVARWIPPQSLRRLDGIAKHQGTILFFAFFVFPGFPKDYLCIFLGLTALPLKVFILMSGIGRIPGTLMLSLQGAEVFQRNYTTLVVLIAISIAFLLPAYFWRQRIYGWVDRSKQTDGPAPEKVQ